VPIKPRSCEDLSQNTDCSDFNTDMHNQSCLETFGANNFAVPRAIKVSLGQVPLAGALTRFAVLNCPDFIKDIALIRSISLVQNISITKLRLGA